MRDLSFDGRSTGWQPVLLSTALASGGEVGLKGESDRAEDGERARPPESSERMSCRFVDAPHPSTLDVETLSKVCRFRAQRRGGPGGQHRNKTSSGVFMEHPPTGVVAEATERRSQAQNRAVAFGRLRLLLAVAVRTAAVLAAEPPAEEAEIRRRYRGTRLRLADSNVDNPAVLALLLNDLHAAGGQPSLVARQWKVTTTAIVSLLRTYRPALELVNQIRGHHGRPPLR